MCSVFMWSVVTGECAVSTCVQCVYVECRDG